MSSSSPTLSPTASPIENYLEESRMYAVVVSVLLLITFSFCCATILHSKSLTLGRREKYKEMREILRGQLIKKHIPFKDKVTNIDYGAGHPEARPLLQID